MLYHSIFIIIYVLLFMCLIFFPFMFDHMLLLQHNLRCMFRFVFIHYFVWRSSNKFPLDIVFLFLFFYRSFMLINICSLINISSSLYRRYRYLSEFDCKLMFEMNVNDILCKKDFVRIFIFLFKFLKTFWSFHQSSYIDYM